MNSLPEKIVFSEKEINEAIDVCRNCFGVISPEEKIKEIVSKNQDYAKDATETSVEDTMVREWLIQIIAEEVVGRDWPCGGSTSGYYDSFFREFRKNAVSYGYSVKEGFFKMFGISA